MVFLEPPASAGLQAQALDLGSIVYLEATKTLSFLKGG